jgi:hypothetical protein
MVTPQKKARPDPNFIVDNTKYDYIPRSQTPRFTGGIPYLVANTPELFYIEAQGNLDLIYCNNHQTEAYLQQLISVLTKKNPTPNEKKLIHEIIDHTAIFMIVARGTSKANDKPQYKTATINGSTNNGIANSGGLFKKIYFLCYAGPANVDGRSIRHALNYIAKVTMMRSISTHSFHHLPRL